MQDAHQADVLFGFLVLTPYRPPALPYLLSVVVAVALIVWARRMPARWASPDGGPVRSPAHFAWFGFIYAVVFFALAWAVPETHVPPLITFAALIGLAVYVRRRVLRLNGAGHGPSAIASHSPAARSCSLSCFRPSRSLTLTGRTTLLA